MPTSILNSSSSLTSSAISFSFWINAPSLQAECYPGVLLVEFPVGSYIGDYLWAGSCTAPFYAVSNVIFSYSNSDTLIVNGNMGANTNGSWQMVSAVSTSSWTAV